MPENRLARARAELPADYQFPKGLCRHHSKTLHVRADNGTLLCQETFINRAWTTCDECGGAEAITTRIMDLQAEHAHA